MSWVKVDDRANEHRKQVAAGPAACWLWACGLMYCNRQERPDGRIPGGVVTMLFPGATKKMAARLVEVGLWEPDGDGYKVHDYFAFQPTPEELDERRQVRSERGKKGASARWGTANEMQRASKKDGSKHRPSIDTSMLADAPDPDPDPDPHSPPENLIQEPVHGSREGAPEPAVGSTKVTVRELDYQRAYERGVARVTGGFYAMPTQQRPELHQAIVGHARKADGQALRGEALTGFLEDAAADFATFVLRLAKTEPKALDLYSGLGPRGFLRFLNREALSAEARRVG